MRPDSLILLSITLFAIGQPRPFKYSSMRKKLNGIQDKNRLLDIPTIINSNNTTIYHYDAFA